MQVKSNAECSVEHSAVVLTCIKLPHGFKTFVLSIFEWPLMTGITVSNNKGADQTARMSTLLLFANPENGFSHIGPNVNSQFIHNG